MTYLQLVNTILKRMRFSTVSTVDQSSYSRLIGEFVNEAKREVEDNWDWLALRSTYSITTVEGTFRHTFSGVGDRWRLLKDYVGRPLVYNDTKDAFLRQAPSQRWMNARLNDNDTTKNEPSYFDFNGVDSNNDPFVDLWPIADGQYTINFDLVVPQSDLEDDNTTLLVPKWPVILGGWAKAMEEQGENGGNSPQSIHIRYHDALADAIVYDQGNSAPQEDSWWVV